MIELQRDQREVFKAAEEFARGEFDLDQVLAGEKARIFPAEQFRKAGELGFIGVHWPEKYEGGGMSLLDQLLIAEAWASQDSAMALALLSSVFAAEAVLLFGREDQREQWLPKVALGEEILGCSLGQGLDLALDWDNFSLQVDGGQGQCVLNGKLDQVLNGLFAQGVIAMVAPGDGRGHGDLALLLLSVGQRKGLQRTDAGPGLGWNLSPQARFILHQVQVHENEFLRDSLVPREDMLLLWARQSLMVAGLAVGIARGSYARCLEYVSLREQFGKKLIAFPLTRDKLAGMVMKVEQARLMTHAAARSLERIGLRVCKKKERTLLSQAFMAKFTASRAAREVADQTIQLLGGYGYMREYHVERFYRDAKVCELLCGSCLAQRELIFHLAVSG